MATILVIDDDAQIRNAVGNALKKAGHQVAVAPDGGAGLRLHRADPVDLVITDLFMPERDGLELIGEFQRSHPHVAVIAMSGSDAASQTMLCVAKELGAVAVLQKPFDSDVLLMSVEQALQAA